MDMAFCLTFWSIFEIAMDGGPIDGIRGASMVQTDAMYQVWISKLHSL